MVGLRSQIDALFDQAVKDAYERGKADAKRELLEFLGGKPQPGGPSVSATPNDATDSDDDDQERQRAPKGMARKLILRALRKTMPGLGIEPIDATKAARNDLEKMVKVSSIRGELRRGRDDGRYVERDGRWFLAAGEVDEEAESDAMEAPTSASGSSKGGSEDAAALDLNPDRF